LAKYLVTAHRGTIEPWNYQSYRKYFSFISKNQKYIFLQHGITKDDVSNVLGRLNTSFDLFITGAKPEYEYINSTFGYTNGEVVYTGFARFDDLYEVRTKKQILLMPTWRKKLAWSPVQNLRDSFMQSEYYHRYQSLISNEELIRELERTGFELIFYPHHEMQQFINCFSTRSVRVVIAEEHKFDVQALLKDSAILITDYSSVFFDFGYMDKPVLYYQFDSNDFFKTHYKQGYFSYELDGFGPVLTEEAEVVDYLKNLIHYNCQVDEEYRQRIKKFFTIKDRNNCERIYESIIQLK
jgi:CDP-glycerol glycerophosphotransferase (TagB/SpsB family)